MPNWIQATVAGCAALCSAASIAAPVSLGTLSHAYGTDAGRQLSSVMGVFHPNGNCDTANAATITVKATSSPSCNRFADVFDFSGIDFDSITRFELTISFTGARDQLLGFERWNVRGASNYSQSATTFGTTLNASGSQTFVFDSSMALFNDMLAAHQFVLSFATDYGSSMNFNLSSASLQVFGTPAAVAEVPEPASLALVGLSLVALCGAQRRRKASTD